MHVRHKKTTVLNWLFCKTDPAKSTILLKWELQVRTKQMLLIVLTFRQEMQFVEMFSLKVSQFNHGRKEIQGHNFKLLLPHAYYTILILDYSYMYMFDSISIVL